MSAAPAWLRAVSRAEAAIGAPASRVTNSDQAATVLLGLGHLRRSVSGVTAFCADLGVHLLGMPSRGDVRRLELDVQRVYRLLEDVALSLDEERGDHGSIGS